MNFQELVKYRRSSRWMYSSKKQIPDDDLKKILEAARWAPTPHNRQPYEIIVVTNKKIIKELSEVEFRLSKREVDEHASWTFSVEELETKGIGVQEDVLPKFVLDLQERPELINDDEFWKRTMKLYSLLIQASSALLFILYDPTIPGIGSLKNVWGLLSIGAIMQNIWLAANDFEISAQLISGQTMAIDAKRKIYDILNIPKKLKLLVLFRLGYEKQFGKNGTPYRRKLEDFVHFNKY
ncbi:MAG: nitroreductase family protein [Candidatus Helarchaeota archaeon]